VSIPLLSVTETINKSPWQNGVPVANAVANVALNNNGKVSSFSSSFVELCMSVRVFYFGVVNQANFIKLVPRI
jgi:hypothetical protein